MANEYLEALTRIHEKIILGNDYVEVPIGDPDKVVMATLKMNRLAKPKDHIIFKSYVLAAFYDVTWNHRDNMAYGQKRMWDWIRRDFVESRVELNMDEVEIKHDDSETEIKNLQADSLHYCGVCSRLVDGRRIYRNGYIPIVPCGSSNR